ncbi:hypothetical protein ONZ45_g2534 [Pleurotus djamor]|nr:hypothetical protein ONZ45_g2534 [Pleurotus djamor]
MLHYRIGSAVLFALSLLANDVGGASHEDVHIRAPPKVFNGHWVAAWASMPQLTETSNLPPTPFTTSSVVFANSTLRQTIHVTATTSRIRLRISNAFGLTDLPITAATIAKPVGRNASDTGAGSPLIDTSTIKTLTFSGSPSFTIPNGALVVSDPINMEVKAGTELSIGLFLATGQTGNDITSHPGSRTTIYMGFGNLLNTASMANAVSIQHWYFISTLDAWVPRAQRTLAIVGDSITDGRGSIPDANNRWPDLVFARLQASNSPSLKTISFANQAAGGNRILADGLGPNALGRFDRDVLSQPGVKFAMIFEGVNDIGVAAATTQAQQDIGDRVIAALKQIIIRSHASGIPIFGATITPFSQPGFASTVQAYSSATREATRQRVNAFIRDSGEFDAVVDFDAAIRDPTNPSQIKTEFDSGDFLHPSVAGYQAMAQAFPLNIFAPFEGGVFD